ncbi:MAG: cytochrome c [Gammaproteobacteria bacterium]|nr:cytochrome c [Rhodocyclaceae bacterium]MBU3908063.1 cytochrome c [Gammaproteobacteria bacterium]MBU3990326.1 cytochrome c [Gammaproteobacteria bacterium]MBU4006020.1 cytochrome c [Gammaproteobacteria bacterium]MBU4022007.1 cytochrome c [Gammaproteobacteria bacterium]
MAVSADKFDLGKQEYMDKCAVCHGQSGKGDGGVTGILKHAPTDLTVLSKNNGGVFPVDRIYQVIDGRVFIMSHGDRDMPIWGKAYQVEKVRAAEHYVDVPYNMEMYVRSRILALIDYLNRIQRK